MAVSYLLPPAPPLLLLAKPTSQRFYCNLPVKHWRDDVVSSPFVPLFGAVSSRRLPCILAGLVPSIPGGDFVSPTQPTQTLHVSSVTLMLCKTPIQMLTKQTGEWAQFSAREERPPTEELLFPASSFSCITATTAHATHLAPLRRKRKRR